MLERGIVAGQKAERFTGEDDGQLSMQLPLPADPEGAPLISRAAKRRFIVAAPGGRRGRSGASAVAGSVMGSDSGK